MESLSIQIIAHCDNTNVPKVISFTPEQYFDLDPGEMPDVDSVPLYSDLEKYVDVYLMDLKYLTPENAFKYSGAYIIPKLPKRQF